MTTSTTTTAGTPPPPPEDGIGDRIKQRREELRLSVDQLAAMTARYDYHSGNGVSRATIYSYESKGTKPGAREIRLLSGALNVSPNWLILGEEWNVWQGEDAELASMFRGMVERATYQNRTRLPKFGDRDDLHRSNLEEIKKAK